MLSSIIANWWIGFLLAAVGGIITWFFKRYIKLEKENFEKHVKDISKEVSSGQEKMLQQIKESQENLRNDIFKKYEEVVEDVAMKMALGRAESKEDDAELKGEIDRVEDKQKITQAGILAIYKPQFIQHCDDLITKEDEITVDEYDEIKEAHEAYNALGGNHRGDEKFNMVKAKFEKQHNMR